MAREPAASAAERMLRAAADLLQTGGIEAVSTRAVAAAAGVQPPTIYRQFGDKDGLLDAVAGFVLEGYMEKKRLLTDASRDPAVELRDLWDLHAEFGLNQPACYVLTFGQARPGRTVPVAAETVELLTDVIGRLGDKGRLRMSVERATSYFRSCGAGYILIQIATQPDKRDPGAFIDHVLRHDGRDIHRPETQALGHARAARPRGGVARSVARQGDSPA